MADHCPGVMVCTGARLHFGLFDTRPPYGGVGIMIDSPETCLTLTPAERFDPGLVQSERLTAISRRFTDHCLGYEQDRQLPACRIRVPSVAPSHIGLGSGTQLSLALAVGLAKYFDVAPRRDELITLVASRGQRSAVGSLGFFEGGLICEQGVTQHDQTRSGWQRVEIPSHWQVVICRPLCPSQPMFGPGETQAFDSLPSATSARRETLRALGEEIVRACESKDFANFSELVTRFNRLSGELFAPRQGGCYNGLAVSETIEKLKRAGARAYGQSSWGPVVFAFCDSSDEVASISQAMGDLVMTIAKPKCVGAAIGQLRLPMESR